MAPEDMTSKEYYLDSTAHFAVHEVIGIELGWMLRVSWDDLGIIEG